MTDATDTDADGADSAGADDGKQQGKTFTQAELDQIVRERLVQQAKNKFGDYDDLKTKAGTAQTLEERLGTLETELSTTKAASLRTAIAAEFGISTKKGAKGEPSDAELLLTGTDEATLTAQAQRVAGAVADRKKQGNVASKEGTTTTTGDRGDEHDFVSELFGRSD